VRAHWLVALWLGWLGAAPAGAAGRARLGGTLAVGLVGEARPVTVDAEADAPEAASARALLALPLCRLPGPVPLLASVSPAGEGAGQTLQLVPRAEARFVDGTPLLARDVAFAWQRLVRAHSPYLALLHPLAGLAEMLEAAVQKPQAALPLALGFAWPDLEASLCHPALTPYRPGKSGEAEGVGLYSAVPGGRLLASRQAPGGPPFPASLTFAALTARTAGRLLLRGEVQAVLGEAGPKDASALLFATYLVYAPEALPPGARAALEAVDREALVRTFVPGPAVALHALLPPPLVEAAPAPPAARPPTVPAPARSFTLGYSTSVPEHRAVAERLQVLLHDAGYPVQLRPDTQSALAEARRTGAVQAALVSLLLPPLPAPALALVLGLTEDTNLLDRELPALGAAGDASARAARVAERASALGPALPVLPLYARGLRVRLSESLLGAKRDGFGLLLLDDAWLRP